MAIFAVLLVLLGSAWILLNNSLRLVVLKTGTREIQHCVTHRWLLLLKTHAQGSVTCSDQPDFFEGVYIPHKRPASEEALSRGLSNLNISPPPGVKYNEVEMVSIEEPSDESDDECDNEKGLLLPEELRRGYQQLGTDGGFPDSYLRKILAPKACLALVPYIPRPPLPLVPASDHPTNNSHDDKDVTEAKTTEFEPMECLLASQAPELRSSTSTFDSSLSLGQVGGYEFTTRAPSS
ncbi:unnamed protein product [Taenia asiatica]|uniref:Secreted protein n=1 Tax=Taenia asiatica TaxID=60517 RepID=A0A0R3WBD3_TAEAS|nr:unnamed protein product [Taenia asiatica]